MAAEAIPEPGDAPLYRSDLSERLNDTPAGAVQAVLRSLQCILQARNEIHRRSSSQESTVGPQNLDFLNWGIAFDMDLRRVEPEEEDAASDNSRLMIRYASGVVDFSKANERIPSANRLSVFPGASDTVISRTIINDDGFDVYEATVGPGGEANAVVSQEDFTGRVTVTSETHAATLIDLAGADRHIIARDGPLVDVKQPFGPLLLGMERVLRAAEQLE